MTADTEDRPRDASSGGSSSSDKFSIAAAFERLEPEEAPSSREASSGSARSAESQRRFSAAPGQEPSGGRDASRAQDKLQEIRSILFGTFERDVRTRLGRLEERLDEHVAALRDDVQQLRDRVEGAHDERRDLADRLTEHEDAYRDDIRELERTVYMALQALQRDMARTASDLEARMDAVEQALDERLQSAVRREGVAQVLEAIAEKLRAS
jgi:chromosome segregation ATPase